MRIWGRKRIERQIFSASIVKEPARNDVKWQFTWLADAAALSLAWLSAVQWKPTFPDVEGLPKPDR
jgi:hypothetical protein